MVELLLNRAHLRLRLRYVHPRSQARDGESVVTAASVKDQWVALAQWCVNISVVPKTKFRTKNSDDGVLHAVQGHGLAKRPCAAVKPISPQPVTDDDRVRSVLPLFLG